MKTKNYKDSMGNIIPAKFLDKKTKKADAVVEKVVKKAIALQKKIISTKQKMTEEISNYLDFLENEYKTKPQWRGNIRIMNVAQNKRINIIQQYHIDYTETINIAREKINSCLKKWSNNAPLELQVIVQNAFQIDKKGNYDKKRLADLLKIKINDPTWQEAMNLIQESTQYVSSKTYIYIEVLNNGKWEKIKLNFSDL